MNLLLYDGSLKPTEEYRRRFKLALGNQYFPNLAELRIAIWSALDTIRSLEVVQCLCPCV